MREKPPSRFWVAAVKVVRFLNVPYMVAFEREGREESLTKSSLLSIHQTHAGVTRFARLWQAALIG